MKKIVRGHTELNHGPLDLQSNALPLSYTPLYVDEVLFKHNHTCRNNKNFKGVTVEVEMSGVKDN